MKILPIGVFTFFRMGIFPIQSRLVAPPVYNRQYARCCTQNGPHDGESERIRQRHIVSQGIYFRPKYYETNYGKQN